jgi:hypothetical protein
MPIRPSRVRDLALDKPIFRIVSTDTDVEYRSLLFPRLDSAAQLMRPTLQAEELRSPNRFLREGSALQHQRSSRTISFPRW